jgi:hypothetical protein
MWSRPKKDGRSGIADRQAQGRAYRRLK